MTALPQRSKFLKSPITAGRRPDPDINQLVDRVMDPYGEHAELESLRKEHDDDAK
jgi:hypothetical protein